MKFHIAFVLLVVFGVAQAGEEHIAATFGTGLEKYDEKGDDLLDGGEENRMGSIAQTMMSETTENTERASERFGAKSEAYYNYAELFAEMGREKRQSSEYHRGRAENSAQKADEAYKKAQLHRRQAKDKQAIAKEYEERAQKHDRRSKQMEIKELEDYRKSHLEMSEHKNSLGRANYHLVTANSYHELSQLDENESNECEQYAKAFANRAEEYKKLHDEYKDKAQKEKEEARLEEGKSKENDVKAEEFERSFIESTKKVHQYKHYECEFKLKAEDERHKAQLARIRHNHLTTLANLNKQQYLSVRSFYLSESKYARTFHAYSNECNKEKNALTTGAAHLLKQHRYTANQIYTKQPFQNSNYHEE